MTLYHGDCLTELSAIPDNSVDSVVTDPPYGLVNTSSEQFQTTLAKWVQGERDFIPEGKGFMSKSWDAFVPPPAVWDECLRVLKPGGHMAVFAGARTQDLMGLSIRLAGFEIRDTLGWIYGSGFPKSMDMSKAIDKGGGLSPKIQAQTLRAARERADLTREQVAVAVGCTASSVRDWEEGRARATGRPIEHITPSPQYRSKLADLLGYTDDERKITGTTIDRRNDGTVIGLGHSGVTYGDSSTDAAREWSGWGTALKPAIEPILLARKPLVGTVAQNVLEHGVGGLNIDACRVETDDDTARTCNGVGNSSSFDMAASGERRVNGGSPAGRFPANVLLDEHAAKEMDRQSGILKSGANPTRRTSDKFRNAYGDFKGQEECTPARGADSGGASRFFPVFKYQAKAPKKERPVIEREDGTKIQHPTVKPLALMSWLITLITPEGGTTLDPFAGSGATVEAAILDGFNIIGIERESDYLELVQVRMAHDHDKDRP